MKHFFYLSVFPYFSKKFIVKTNSTAYTICSSSSTEVEERAIQEALIKSGVLKTIVIEKTIAAAVGCGLPVLSQEPIFIVDLGAGLFELSIILMGGIVQSKSLKSAGDTLDRTLQNYIHLKHGVLLGDNTIENIKIKLLDFGSTQESIVIRGKSIENGLPKSIRIKTNDVREALISQFMYLIESIKEIIESAPPEIIDETIKRGIVLTGGIAKTPFIDDYLSKEIKIPVIIPENPDQATILGLQKISTDKKAYQKLHYKI
jgi:rod shape-determining protein MreB